MSQKRNQFSFTIFLLLFLVATLLGTSYAEDSCPAGMRIMNLESKTSIAYGNAKSDIPALNNGAEGNGALWFNRKVLIEPRFEVHLKASLEPTGSQALEGFTIVISNSKNTVGPGAAETIGYYGFSKSYVIEFDFNKNSYDPDASSYSLRYCDTNCQSDDRSAIKSERLSNQRYDATKTMNWDFRLIYIDHVLTVYSGPNDVLFTYPVDLETKFESYIAYIGFTAYTMKGSKSLSLSGTFLCEDNFDMSQIDGKFYVQDKTYDTYNYKAGQKVMYLFQFKNNKGQTIPHCNKNGIWSYDFSLALDCSGSNSQLTVKDDYNLILSMNACSEIGKHSIAISEASSQEGPTKYYNIEPGDIKTISLIGHDGTIATIPTQVDQTNQAKILKYGPVSGDFSLTQNLNFILDFDILDSYGNVVDIGDSSDEMLETAQLGLVNSNGAKVTMAKKDNHYQLTINVVNTGTYVISKNEYMTDAYEIIVRAGEVDPRNSYCTIEGYSEPPTLKQGVSVTYSCFFRDSSGNTITANDYDALSDYDFSCNAIKRKPTSAEFTTTTDKETNVFTCKYTPTVMGEYSFNGYLTKKGSSTKTELPAKINGFSVMPNFDKVSLIGAKVYNPNSLIWYEIDKFSFVYKADTNGFITAIDLTDTDHSTLVSSFGTITDDFKFASFSAALISPHDSAYKVKLVAQKTTINGKEYIGIYTANKVPTDNVVKKSSFEYQLKFVWDGTEKSITMKYKFASAVTIGSDSTCFHDLSPEKTQINFDSVSLVNNNVEQLLGTMELRTTDGYLYNYDIGNDKIQIKLDPEDENVQFRVVSNVVLGTYNVYGKVNGATFTGTLYFYVNGKECNQQVRAKAGNGVACTLQFQDPELFTLQSTGTKEKHYKAEPGAYLDGFLNFHFTLYDKDEFMLQQINIADCSIDITSLDWGTDTSKYTCLYDNKRESFNFKYTYLQYQNDLTYVITTKECQNKYFIHYDQKSGGTVSMSSSSYSLLQNKINVGQTAYIEVTLMDSNKVLLGKTEGALENSQKGVRVYGTKDSETFEFQFDSITSAYTLRYKYTFDAEGTYSIIATYNDQELSIEDKTLTVILEKISLANSQMFIILDSTISMSTQATQNVQNPTQIPRYKLSLYNSENKAITNYDRNVDVSCVMTHKTTVGSEDNYPLLVDMQDGYINFVHDAETQGKYSNLVRGFYNLTVTVGTENKIFQLYLAGIEGSEDASNNENFDPSKTEFNVIEVSGEAGVTYSVYLTFKAEDGLRWNYPGELSAFTYANSYKLTEAKLSVTAQKGAKNGQFIININQKQATTGKAGNKLTIYYDGNKLSSQVTIVMKCSSLFSLEYDSGCEDGNVFNLPLLKFIPKDRYGNIYTDLFDSSKTDTSTLYRLVRGRSVDDVVLTTYNFVSDNKYLNVLYKTKVATTIEITSDYFSETLTYKIRSGQIYPGTSSAELKTTSKTIAGSIHDLMIYPKDEFGNVVDYLNENDLKNFDVWYQVKGSDTKYNFSDKCKLVTQYISSDSNERNLVEAEEEVSYSAIQCSTAVDKVGTINFYVNYINEHIYAIGSTYTMGDSSETTAAPTKGTTGKFFVRLDGIIPTEPQSHPSSEYGAKVQIEGVIINNTFTHSVTGEGVNYNLYQLPTSDQIKTSLKGKTIQYDPNIHYVLWYVIKLCGDGWHIDGVLLKKDLFNLAYSANAPAGIWSNMPDGKQYEHYANATISNKVPKRSDGEFRNWNTEENGSGTTYKPNGKILMDKSITLHAQWKTYDKLTCNSCTVTLKSSQINFDNLQTVYTKTSTTMKIDVKTTVESSSLPKFEITFYDTLNNVITNPQMVELLNLNASLGGTEVKLCVTNSASKKIINVCPPSNGDDNYNKWYYLTNGDTYSLILTGPKTITYPLQITGGYTTGSSDPVDLTKTYLNPTSLILPAGDEGTVLLEMRTAGNVRKNYWYPNMNDNITVTFTQDQDSCNYQLSKAENPGQYYIKFSCTKKNNQNSFAVTVEGQQITQKVSFVINAGKSYYLEVPDTSLFDVSSNKYTFKNKFVNGETVKFNFKLLDKYKNYLDYTFENTGTNVRSDLYGISTAKYGVNYDQNKYVFTDKINEYLEKHTWEIQCLESDNKYYFIYGKVPGAVDPSKSDFVIDKTEYIIKETSTVEVTLKDSYGINVGIVEGRLEKEKQYLVVQATGTQTLTYVFDSISTKNTLIYKYKMETVGNFDVTAKYNSVKIANKSIPIVVAYQKIDTKRSELYITTTQEQLMLTSTKTIINNLQDYPYFKYYFYTSDGVKITNYDKSTPITCKMTKDSYSWDLVVTKEDGYVKFNYKDEFKNDFKGLPTGDYFLLVTVGETPITYPLYLLGEKGSEDASPSTNYDRTKALVTPVRIDGIAGEQYKIDIEFRAADGLRFNQVIQLNSLTVANSYELTSKYLVIDKKLGEKKGQCTIYLIQYKATTGSPDNVLTIYYEGNALTQKVNVAMKCNKLDHLTYVSGLRNGTVLDPPTLQFSPYDAYENLYTDLFDPTKYDDKALQELTVGTSRDGYTLTVTSTVSDGQYLNVQYGSKKVTTIDITSPYFPETYTYSLGSGPIDPDTTYAELVPNTNTTAGSSQELLIHPKDVYGNDIDNLDDEDVDKFIVTYEEVGTPNKHDVSDTCKLEGKNIRCTTPIKESGEIEFKIDYVDDPVVCKECTLTINPGVVDFAKTTVVYTNTGKEMSTTTKNKVEVTVTPTFELTFHDQYNNVITDTEVTKKIDTKPYFLDTDIDLCIADKENKKEVTVCKTESGENENKWYYLVNGDNYNLKLTRKDEELKFPVEVSGGAKEGSSAPADIDKTYINPNSLTLTAGVEDKITLELKTADNKQKNYWFLNPEDHIKVSFDKDKDSCSYKLNQAEKIGQYYIYFNCTKKIDQNEVTITIDNEVVPQKVSLKVIPADPAKALLFYMNDEQIKQQALGSVTVEEQMKIKELLYDEFDNRITEITFSTSMLGIKLEPNVQSRPDSVYSATPVIQANGDIIITMKSTLAGEHILTGAYFPLQKYTILFTHGKPSAENSLLVVEKTKITAGETDTVLIHPYDKYNNKIDASEFKDSNPYSVNYVTEGSSTKTAITNYEIKKVNGDNVLAYTDTFTKAGIDTAYGYIDTDECKCSSCVINISTAGVEFTKNDYKRFEITNNEFENIKNGTLEKNTKNDPIYRIYPKDTYDNAIEYIPEEKLKTYTCHLKSKKEGTEYHLKLNNQEYTNQPYAEFVKDDTNQDAYSTLVGGVYYLIFEGQGEEKVFEIILEGTSGDSDASNKPLDEENTHINSYNLKYTAGQKGDMYIELRTEDNLRRNSWDNIPITVESCDKDDKTFTYNVDKAGTLGVFYITVSTTKSNTYPTTEECPLTIKVNNVVVPSLHPTMEVSPAEIYRTEILSTYYKVATSNKILKDGTADSNYIFEVKSFDIYDNLCPTVQEIVGIKVLLLGDEVKSVSDDVPATGFRKYTVSTTKTGVYTVTSAMNPTKHGMYLPNDSTFNIYPGELYKIVIEAVTDQIKAGEKPAVYIQCYDKKDNKIPGKDFKDKFNVEFYDSKSEVHGAGVALDKTNEYKAIYTSQTPVTIVGTVTCGATYNTKNEKIDTSHISISVVAADPDPSKSVLTRETSKNSFTVYKNGDKFTIDTDELLILNVTLYDTYGNRIYEIPTDSTVLNPTMSGNDMDPISFDVTKKTDYFNLDYINNQEYIDTYTHLVDGEYELTYKVKTVLGEATFKYTLVIAGGDTTHGNGPICSAKIYPNDDVTFYAGETYSLTLELRTCNGLLYNRQIEPSDVSATQLPADQTFKYSIYQAGDELGVYTVDIYSEKKGRYTFNPVVTSGEKKHDAGIVNYRVLPGRVPYPDYTVILVQPEPEISAEATIEITFLLADKFNNQFEERNDIIENNYLYVTNNENIVSKATKEISEVENGNKFRVTLPAMYPPNLMYINTVYNDGNDSVVCFPQDIITKIAATIDNTLTKVTSRNAKKIMVGDTLDMQLYIYDHKGICLDNDDYSSLFTITVNGPLESADQQKKEYYVRKAEDESLDCQNKYEIVTIPSDRYTKTGTYNIKVTSGDYTVATYTQICYSLEYSKNGFLLKYVDANFDPDQIPITDTIKFIVSGSDEFGNELNEPLLDDMTMAMTLPEGETNYTYEKVEVVSGQLQFNVNSYKVGKHQLHLYFKDEEVLTVNMGNLLPTFTILTGSCRAENNDNFDLSPLEDADVNRISYFIVKCYDIYGNPINHGGEEFTTFGTLIVGEVQASIDTAVVDNNDGTYTVKFTPPIYGTYVVKLLVGDGERYGDDVQFEIKKTKCEGDTPYMCPNEKKCVSNRLQCIPPELSCGDASHPETPFKCLVNGVETCVKSRNECDCPKGYLKCTKFMTYCVPEDREDMCPFFLQSAKLCRRLGTKYTMFEDGICRLSDAPPLNMPVCPLGKILCADLSCRDNYDECYVSPKCLGTEVRCADQTCASSAKFCPSIITCQNPDDVACPNSECMSNEIYCEGLPLCSEEAPYLCRNLQCALIEPYCSKRVACGDGKVLCEDNICRTSC